MVSPVIAWQPLIKKRTTNVPAPFLIVRIINISSLVLKCLFSCSARIVILRQLISLPVRVPPIRSRVTLAAVRISIPAAIVPVIGATDPVIAAVVATAIPLVTSTRNQHEAGHHNSVHDYSECVHQTLPLLQRFHCDRLKHSRSAKLLAIVPEKTLQLESVPARESPFDPDVVTGPQRAKTIQVRPPRMVRQRNEKTLSGLVAQFERAPRKVYMLYFAIDCLRGSCRASGIAKIQIPIHYIFVDAHEIGIGVAARVLLQLHGDLIAALQLVDRVFSAVVNGTGVSAIADHPVAAVLQAQMNLARRSIDSVDLCEELVLIQLQRRSAHQGDVVAATCAHNQGQTDNHAGRGTSEWIHKIPPSKGSTLSLSAICGIRILCGKFSRPYNRPPVYPSDYERCIRTLLPSRVFLTPHRPRTRNRFDRDRSKALTPTLNFSSQPPSVGLSRRVKPGLLEEFQATQK